MTLVDAIAFDADLARRDALKAGDQVQERGLAAAAGSDEDQKLATVDLDIDALQDLRISEALLDVVDTK